MPAANRAERTGRRGGRKACAAALGLAVAVGLSTQTATPGEVTVTALPGAHVSVSVRSMKEVKFLGVIRQQYDFSCGSAAVASLLTYHYGRPTSEREVFEAMWEKGDQAKISRYGFSLLDMKGYLASRGLAADGFRVPLEKLAEVQVPAIALIDTDGYRHFVVIKGIDEERVLVGDPALGVRVMRRAEFEAIWNGILFVLRGEGEIAREHFNQEAVWNVKPDSPVEWARFRDTLGSFTLNLPGPGEF